MGSQFSAPGVRAVNTLAVTHLLRVMLQWMVIGILHRGVAGVR